MEGWEDDEYKAFVEKFKRKKTTDDCYTPPNVYAAIAGWVAREYQLREADFVRPFYPGGDYRRFDYPDGCVVVDNPPFSLLAEIVAFYTREGLRFFLFAPTLTLFSSSSSSCAALPCGVQITYDNGAQVNTSFLTNLEPDDIQVRTVPELYRLVKAADDENRKAAAVELPKYVYPDCVLTAAAAYRLCKYGVAYTLRRDECLRIPALDAQRREGKSVFGSGYLLSSRAAAERAAAERAAAERAAAERAAAERAAAERAAAERAAATFWQLSAREKAMIEYLDGKEAAKS